MAPEQPSTEEWPDYPTGYNEFFEDLKRYYEERGTPLDTNAKVNGKHIDLYRLFEIVNSKGGYDRVSSEKLAWRKIGQEFSLGQNNAAAYAFALKTTYYKNLAAYEIKRVHKQEPPPVHIFEDSTAKGGNLLTRTIYNFQVPQSRELAANGRESEVSDDDTRKTPKSERMDGDEPPGSGGRTRGLRQAPPPRVLFQPDVSSTRQSRQTSNQITSPQPPVTATNVNYGSAPTMNPNSSSFNLANYEPRPPVPLALRNVPTPANNPASFKEKLRRLRNAQLAQMGRSPVEKPPMLPGTGYEGPNIYVRTVNSLRCGIPKEVDFALHHLVKISHERGDRFKFEAFPGLADGLVEKLLEISTLFYDVKWEISYSRDINRNDVNVLDGLNGTTDILARIQGLEKLTAYDGLEDAEFSHAMSNYNEAGLIARNMVLLEENAKYLSEHLPIKDFLIIALNLPKKECLIEIKFYALEIAEQLTKYWALGPSDPLYTTLLEYLDDGEDRGVSLTTLRALSYISMNLEVPNLLPGVSMKTIGLLVDWLMLDDEELVGTILDFLYQYTAIPENVALLIQNCSKDPILLYACISQLGRLLMYNAQEVEHKQMISPAIPGQPRAIPGMPQELIEQIQFRPEPDRSSQWLRCCFEEHAESEITQIALWQAYQGRFTQSNEVVPLLAAAEFIKNVSTTFTAANAQVINEPNSVPRFIIKGIRPRHYPTTLTGQVYWRCHWQPPGSATPCGSYQLKAEDMFEHFASYHMQLTKEQRTKEGIVTLRQQMKDQDIRVNCHWRQCQRMASTNGTLNPTELNRHFQTLHLPNAAQLREHTLKHNPSARVDQMDFGDPKCARNTLEFFDLTGALDGKPAEYRVSTYYDTATDERGEPIGLPVISAYVLRNLARNLPKAVVALELKGTAERTATQDWMERLFLEVRHQLIHVLANNRPMTANATDVIFLIDKHRSK